MGLRLCRSLFVPGLALRILPNCTPASLIEFEEGIGVLFARSGSLSGETRGRTAFPITRRHRDELHQFQSNLVRSASGRLASLVFFRHSSLPSSSFPLGGLVDGL